MATFERPYKTPSRDSRRVTEPRPPAATRLPDRLRKRAEASFRVPLGNVAVHYNSPVPRLLHAFALTQNPHIYLGPGQERHLPHEVGHILQQRTGAVRSNAVRNGVPVNDDSRLEAEADRIPVATVAPAQRSLTLPLPLGSSIDRLHLLAGTPSRSSTPFAALASGTPVQGKWISTRAGEHREVPDEYVLQQGEVEIEPPNVLKRRESESEEGPPTKKQRTTGGSLGDLATAPDFNLAQHLFNRLMIPETAVLSLVSKSWHSAVNTSSVLPQLQGRRTVGDVDFWSKEEQSEPKRYFFPATGGHISSGTPHVSEQFGFPSHISDVASVHYPRQGFPWQGTEGDYPAKIQFQDQGVPNLSPDQYQVGEADIPGTPSKGRVLTLAPPEAGLPTGTYIEIKSMNQAKRGSLSAGAPRSLLSAEQLDQSLSTVSARWRNKIIKKRERTKRS